ncbi:hypothetical protein [Kribbella sp. NPDC051770]|uniref:hypothetical protein n=1 Tax=Kribbella sp. NPDC051770 TaxID=3155413 RepID=UPI00344A0D36
MLGQIDDYAGWIVGVLGGLTALGVVGRWVVKRVRRFSRKVNDAADTLLGRDEIRHPDTGDVLVQATPGLGRRLASIEGALTSLSDTRSEMQALTARVDGLAASVDQHLADSAEVWSARAHAETKMWETINTIAKAPAAEPWDGVDRRGTGAKNAEQG